MSDEQTEEQTFGDLINLPYAQIVSVLRQRQALILQADHHGRTLLHHAAEVGRSDVAVYLVQAGATVDVLDDTGRTPLHWAANYGHLAILELLLNAGAQTEIVDHGGLTPLRWAEISRSGHSAEAVSLLHRFSDNHNSGSST